VWVDGDPLMEVIAVTLWERCARDDEDMPQLVRDDPRTIAAFAAAVARVFVQPGSVDRAVVYAEVADRLAADAEKGEKEGFTRIYQRAAATKVREWAAEAPLSPYYQHPACGFHWHGRDGMDVPICDGQPVCPRCELAKVQGAIERVQTYLAELERAGWSQAAIVRRIRDALNGTAGQPGTDQET
jgi:hypothetical protein